MKRLQYVALGLLLPIQGSHEQDPILDPPAALDVAPNFAAEDSLIVGSLIEALRALRHLDDEDVRRGTTRDDDRRNWIAKGRHRTARTTRADEGRRGTASDEGRWTAMDFAIDMVDGVG